MYLISTENVLASCVQDVIDDIVNYNIPNISISIDKTIKLSISIDGMTIFYKKSVMCST